MRRPAVSLPAKCDITALVRNERSGEGWQNSRPLRGNRMAIHKRILEWQAAHPNITWIGWGIVWAGVLAILFWPRKIGG